MAKAYRIKDWKVHFEKADHRKCAYMHWLSLPTKHDGKGFRRIARLPNAVSIFCGWCLILQVAARMPIRGTLADKDGPLTAADLADKTGFPESAFVDALAECSNPHIGWIEETEDFGPSAVLRSPPETSRSPPETSGSLPESSGGMVDSSGGFAPSSGGMPHSSGASGGNPGSSGDLPESSGDLPESSGVHDMTRQYSNQKQIITNALGAQVDGAQERRPTEIDALNDSDTFGDSPEMTENRKKVYHAIRDTPLGAAFLAPKHLNDIFTFTENFTVAEVCGAIKVAGSAQVPRQGDAFVSYVAKVLASKSFERASQPARLPPRTRENTFAPVNVDGASIPPVSQLELSRQRQAKQ